MTSYDYLLPPPLLLQPWHPCSLRQAARPSQTSHGHLPVRNLLTGAENGTPGENTTQAERNPRFSHSSQYKICHSMVFISFHLHPVGHPWWSSDPCFIIAEPKVTAVYAFVFKSRWGDTCTWLSKCALHNHAKDQEKPKAQQEDITYVTSNDINLNQQMACLETPSIWKLQIANKRFIIRHHKHTSSELRMYFTFISSLGSIE